MFWPLQYYKKNPYKLKAILIILLPWYCILGFSLDATFTYEQLTSCTPSRVIFHNESTQGAGIHFEWDFGLGAVSSNNSTDLEQVYTEKGSFIVTLYAIEGSDTVKQSQTIVVKNSPEARFEMDHYSGCAPFEAVFRNTTVLGDAPLSLVEWDLRDGNIYSDLEVLTKTYTEEGSYDAILKVTDENGCFDFYQIEESIIVNDKLDIDFEVSDSISCYTPYSVSFSGISSQNDLSLDYAWDFGNDMTSNAKDTSITFHDPGSYSVTLSATSENGCTATIEKKDFIVTGYQDVEILAYQYSSLVSSDQLCLDTIVLKPSVIENINYKWKVRTIMDETFTVDGSTLELDGWGLFFVDITLYYGVGTECMDSVQRTIRYFDKKTYGILMDQSSACNLPQTVNLSTHTTDSSLTDITWYFSDGTVKIGNDVSHVFNTPKTYKEIYGKNLINKTFPVYMTAETGDGCKVTLSETFSVTEPLARFALDQTSGCIPLDVNFTDQNKSPGTISKRSYYINGQEISRTDSSNFVHEFTETGRYEIFSIIENNAGCIDTSYTTIVEAGEKMSLDIALSDPAICIGDNITINGNSNLNDSVDLWHFNSPGIFNISSISPSLEVKSLSVGHGQKDIIASVDFNGCISDAVFSDAFKIESPTGYLTDTFDCSLPLNYTFYPFIENADSLYWQIGDSINHDNNYNHVFNNSGDYNVKLIAFNNSTGCKLETSKVIKVRQVKADFKVDSVVCGLSVDVDALKSFDYINDCYNEGFLWYWGDNNKPDRVYDPVHAHYYSEPGDYNIELHTLADNGCKDTIVKKVKVIDFTPTYNTIPPIGCVPEFTVDFKRTSTKNDVIFWKWYFGDDKKSFLLNNVSHKYESDIGKTWLATLEETDIHGCESSTTKIIKISQPNPGFTATSTTACVGQEIVFKPSDIYNATYYIDFGDGNTSTTSLHHTYNSPGNYSVSLTITKNGCSATSTLSNFIHIVELSAAYSIDTSNTNCYPALVTFTHTPGSTPILSGVWETGDNGTSINFDNSSIQYTYVEPGTYNTSLTLRTYNNCIAKVEKTIEVRGPTAQLSFSPRVICFEENVNFSAYNLKNTDEITWVFGDGQTSNEANVQHIYNSHGSIRPKLIISNENCEKTIDAGILSIRHFRPIMALPPQNYCMEDNWDFDLSYFTIPLTAEWLLNNITITNELYLPEMTLREMGASVGTNTLTVKTQDALCSEEVSYELFVYDTIDFTINGAGAVCRGDTSELWVEKQGEWEIEWETTDQISARNLWFNISISPNVRTYYTAIVTNENNCQARQTKRVDILTDPGYYKLPEEDININLGESAKLTIVSESANTTYRWEPTTNLSCTDCATTYATPENDIVYFVDIINQCSTQKEQFNIEVYNDFYIEAPTAFTPNNDGNNDVFELITMNIVEILEFKIFNRWGNIVFSTNSMDQGWDGKLNGKVQDAGTYAYFVKATNVFGFEVEKKGSITLLK